MHGGLLRALVFPSNEVMQQSWPGLSINFNDRAAVTCESSQRYSKRHSHDMDDLANIT